MTASNRDLFAVARLGDPTWLAHIACEDEPIETFFPPRARHTDGAALERAAELCGACPAADACGRYGADIPHRARGTHLRRDEWPTPTSAP